MDKKLKFGDHIKVKLDSFYHHGIYVSDNEVIHFCSDGIFTILSRDLEVSATDINAFSQGNEVEVVEYTNRFSAEKTVEIARSKIGIHDYDLTFNNCEHFVTSCTTGKSKSETMDRLKSIGIKVRRKTGIHGAICNLNKIFDK